MPKARHTKRQILIIFWRKAKRQRKSARPTELHAQAALQHSLLGALPENVAALHPNELERNLVAAGKGNWCVRCGDYHDYDSGAWATDKRRPRGLASHCRTCEQRSNALRYRRGKFTRHHLTRSA